MGLEKTEAKQPPGAPRPPAEASAGDIEPPADAPEGRGGLGTREAAHRAGARACVPSGSWPAGPEARSTEGQPATSVQVCSKKPPKANPERPLLRPKAGAEPSAYWGPLTAHKKFAAKKPPKG